MKKISLLLIPLILSISIIAFIPNATSQPLEECRDGLIIVKMVMDERRSCLSLETAERWVELGIGIIIDPNYIPPVIEEEPESILEIIEESNPPPPGPELETSTPFVDSVTVTQANQTSIIKSPPKDNPPEQSNANPKPGDPRRVGIQSIQATGFVVIEVFDKEGKLKFHREDHNLVVDIGLQALSDLAFGTTHVTGESVGGFTYISVGTSGTAPTTGDTDCIAQHGSKKQDLSVTNTALGAILNVSWIAELAADTIQEICLTDDGAAATGNLFARQTYTSIPILATDTINAEWTITFADSNGT